MTGIKIIDLPSSTLPYTGTERIPITQDGETRNGTLNSFVNYISAFTPPQPPLTQDGIESAITDNSSFLTNLGAVSSNGSGIVDSSNFRETLLLNDTAIPDSLNWQPNCFNKLVLSGAPIHVLIAGDSLSTQLRMPPNAASAGIIGASRLAGSVNVSDYNGQDGRPRFEDVWLAPYHVISAGGSAVYHIGGQGAVSPVATRANTISVMYIAESGAATFNLMYSTNLGTNWTIVSSISANNGGSREGKVYINSSLPASNSPTFVAGISGVTGGNVRIIGVGLYHNTGLGVVELRALANLGGIDITNFGAVPDSIFTPLWSHMSPDLVVSHFADSPEDWKDVKLTLNNVVTNGTNTITFDAYPPTEYANGNAYRPYPLVGDYITGTNIPPNTRITAHTKNSQTATISNSATGSGTNSANIRGAFVSFYERCSSIKSKTDWIQFSMNPTMSPALSQHPRWESGVSYPVGTRVTTYNADATIAVGRLERVYVSKANHTSDSTTLPNVGASWQTVWDEDLLDAASISAGTGRARQQAKAQREWAIRSGHSFINGFDIFRDYRSASSAGLMSPPDMIHPNDVGHPFKNVMFWSKIPLAQMNLGLIGNVYSKDGNVPLIYTTPASNIYAPGDAGLVEISRPLRMSGPGAQINLGDRNTPVSFNADVAFSNTGGVLTISNFNTSIVAIGGTSSFLGWHPGSNGAVLGGRGSNWWNLGGAGVRLEYTPTTTNYTIAATDYTVNVTSNSVTVQLPLAEALNSNTSNFTNTRAGVEGKLYCIKNSGTGTTVTLSANGAQLINSTNTLSISSGQMFKVQSTGTGWITVM
jgi:hypothetical protein